VSYLYVLERDGFAIDENAEPLMTREIQTDRCVFGEQFGKSFSNGKIAVCSAMKKKPSQKLK
jgi:hypothetical protein